MERSFKARCQCVKMFHSLITHQEKTNKHKTRGLYRDINKKKAVKTCYETEEPSSQLSELDAAVRRTGRCGSEDRTLRFGGQDAVVRRTGRRDRK